MIGPAEIEDMLAEYEEAMREKGAPLLPKKVSWPVTLHPVPRLREPEPRAKAPRRRRAA